MPNDIPTAAPARDAAIREFASTWLAGENQDIYEQMLVTVCRLAKDGADRGDAKLLTRALGELRYAFKVFAPWRAARKVTIFGSARTKPDHPDYKAAEEFGRQISAVGWMAITGAGDGIMKAGHGGAGREASFGVAIRLPFEQKTNEIIADDDKLINFNYFFTRKLMFMKGASAVALFPGGFGTQDELYEALTLVQTGKSATVPIVMIEHANGQYWQEWREYIDLHLLKNGMIGEEDLDLFFVTRDVKAAVREIVDFYRVHHSNRYVGRDLVIRLERRLPDETVEALNDEFANGILVSGRIEQGGPLPEEENEYPEKPRLRFHFNKRSFGLLRRMINRINAAPV